MSPEPFSQDMASPDPKDFIEGLERILGRRIARRAPGRKPTEPPEG